MRTFNITAEFNANMESLLYISSGTIHVLTDFCAKLNQVEASRDALRKSITGIVNRLGVDIKHVVRELFQENLIVALTA